MSKYQSNLKNHDGAISLAEKSADIEPSGYQYTIDADTIEQFVREVMDSVGIEGVTSVATVINQGAAETGIFFDLSSADVDSATVDMASHLRHLRPANSFRPSQRLSEVLDIFTRENDDELVFLRKRVGNTDIGMVKLSTYRIIEAMLQVTEGLHRLFVLDQAEVGKKVTMMVIKGLDTGNGNFRNKGKNAGGIDPQQMMRNTRPARIQN